MSEMEMKTEAEAYEFKFTEELSDEALDRAEGAYSSFKFTDFVRFHGCGWSRRLPGS